MELYSFDHQREIQNLGAVGGGTRVTYWMAETREQAKKAIREETPDEQEPHGLCANCLTELLVNGPYSIERAEGE